MKRIEAFFTGHVQGVGFRFTTWQIARDFDVAGYVENLPDGRVHLIAEGVQKELNRFVSSITKRMDGYIREVEKASLDSSGEFSEFEIRR